MPNQITIKARCNACGKVHEVQAIQSVNTAENPDLKEEVCSGRLFVWTCPDCGAANLAKWPFLYHDPSQNLILWLSDGRAETESQMVRTIASEEGLEAYTCRIVDTPGDLVEKISIFDAGLDDVAMELCKFVTRQELDKDVALRFYRIEGPDHDITLAYPENGQMQMVQIGFNVYEDSAAIVQRNPSLAEASKGLVRVDRDWIERFLA